MKVKIVGTGSAVPEKCVTNDDLSQWMDTSDEWIRSRTGIETRHLAVRETCLLYTSPSPRDTR